MNTQNRAVKTLAELQLIQKSVDIIDNVFDALLKSIKIGQSEIEVANFIKVKVVEFGGQDLSFSTIVAFGENGAEPHHVPTDRKLFANEFITVDMGAKFNDYCSDFTRTFVVGKATKEMKKLYGIVLESMKRASALVEDGVKCVDVDKAARDYIADCGYGDKFIHGTGHGVGIEIHEAPTLNTKSDEVLRNDMVVTIEPGIYFENLLGIRIENMYVVGRNLPLSRHTVELIELEK